MSTSHILKCAHGTCLYRRMYLTDGGGSSSIAYFILPGVFGFSYLIFQTCINYKEENKSQNAWNNGHACM